MISLEFYPFTVIMGSISESIKIKVVEQIVLQSFDGTLGSAPKTTINPAIKVTQLPKVSLQIFDLGFGGG